MKKTFYLFLILLLISLASQGKSYSQELIINWDQAESVLYEYFDMLKNGNTSDMLGLLTGPLLKKRERLLRYNPRYVDFLRERYRDAQFVVNSRKPIDNNKLALDASVHFNDRQKLDIRFILVIEDSRFKISLEKEIN